MAELTSDEIKAYASRWNPKDKDVATVARAFNLAGVAEGVKQAMRIERGEVVWPESLDDIHTERRRQQIVEEMGERFQRIRHLPDAIRRAADSKPITTLSPEELFEVILIGFGLGFLLAIVVSSAIVSLNFASEVRGSVWMGMGLVMGIGLARLFRQTVFLNSRTTLATRIADGLASTLHAHQDQLQRIQSELQNPHHIDLIQQREISNEQKKAAIETAQQVGDVTKTVAAETAEITKNLIQEGQKLKAEHAASQVELIDQLAGNLERPAAQASPADDRDARIAALQAELVKEEEIKALEAKLATLKGGR